MIALVNSAMVELQGALLARTLYPAGHPRVVASERKALDLLREALTGRNEITVFAIHDRVVCLDEVLPASANLLETLFRLLRERGVDQMTVRAGIGAPELCAFLDTLSGPADTAPPLDATAHLTFGAIVCTPPEAERAQVEGIEAAAGSLAETWRGIHESQRVGNGLVADVVSTLSRFVQGSSCTVLPLAFVKGHDEYTFVHIINVGILTMSLGEALGFGAAETHELGIAALLHDVGKMAIPLEILNKNGRFTDEEFRIMQAHPVIGARMLLGTRGVPDLAAIVAYEHHVRYDGGGYPRVPSGWKLNLASRICQVADVYDALRTDRPYRAGLPVEKITTIMRADAGTYFDPDLLGVFFDRVLPRTVETPVRSP